MSDTPKTTDKDAIKAVYDRLAQQKKQESCCPGSEDDNPSGFQPSYENVEGHVPEADLGLGCGIPLGEGELTEGQTVLDLGSGAGNDCFVARRGVGEDGRVIGVDFSENMVEKARQNARDLGYTYVEFRRAEIKDLPVSDESVDVVISNCVLNLVPDKSQAFREIKRVLRPGGYFSVSDVVLENELPEPVRSNVSLQAGCIASALLRDDYLAIIRQTGFEDIEVIENRALEVTEEVLEDFELADLDNLDESEINPEVINTSSITVRGRRP